MMEDNREKQPNRDAVEAIAERTENEQKLREEQINENQPATTSMDEEQPLLPLFETGEAEKIRTQWLHIQGKFVDNPRESVREADELVAGVLKSVTMGFHDRRTSLEKQWNGGENVSTEDLRLALKRYRSFFDRLLTLES